MPIELREEARKYAVFAKEFVETVRNAMGCRMKGGSPFQQLLMNFDLQVGKWSLFEGLCFAAPAVPARLLIQNSLEVVAWQTGDLTA